MNIIRGIDRIALVLAIIAIVPGVFIGAFYVSEQFKTITPEYKEWEEKHGDVWQQEMRYAPDPPRPKWKAPADWQCILGGIAFAPVSFLFVLLGIRGMSRGIRRLSLWIVEGFKE